MFIGRMFVLFNHDRSIEKITGQNVNHQMLLLVNVEDCGIILGQFCVFLVKAHCKYCKVFVDMPSLFVVGDHLLKL